jgi:DNA (cytosine-5)-methyltransferase 1
MRLADSRPVIVDLCCKAGGATKGYQRAGFYVIGVDIEPQPNYLGDLFILADAVEFLKRMIAGGTMEWVGPGIIDGYHASPPCPRYSTVTPKDARGKHPDLIAGMRGLLQATGRPYLIENVVGSPLVGPAQLCGSSFGLDIRRHRLFEANFPISAPPCNHVWQTKRFRSLDSRIVAKGGLASVVGVHGLTQYEGEFDLRKSAMGIDWMSRAELSQAIPPAYTEWIGRQLFAYLRARAGLAVAT